MRHLLLAEDDPLDAKLTLGALEGQHLTSQVFVVTDGEEVLDYLYCRGRFETREKGNPIVLLLDLKMRKIDGLTVLKIIKADSCLKTVPVVVLTSSRETKDLAECYEHGVNAYVVKPVNYEEFAKTVNQIAIFWGAVNEPPPMSETGNPKIDQ